LLAAGTLAGPALAETTFYGQITPLNSLYLQLDVSGGSTETGAGVIDWYSNGGQNQKWYFSQVIEPG
jgi:Ricin-type beta-trefoil lectin domain-like